MVNLDGLVKSPQTDDTVKNSRCKARVLFSSHFSGAVLRNEPYLSYVAVIYPVKSASPSRVARI